MRLPLVALVPILACAMQAHAAELRLRVYTENTKESQTDIDEAWDYDSTGSLYVETTPSWWAAQWQYNPGQGAVGALVVYTAARLQIQVNPITEWSGTITVAMYDPATDEPQIPKWFPIPVTAEWSITSPSTDWSWLLPDPPLIPNTYTVITNPAKIRIHLATVPEPALLGLWLIALSWAGVRRWRSGPPALPTTPQRSAAGSGSRG